MRWYIPYGNPTYFLWLGLALIPLMIGLLYGHRFRGYQTLISLLFLVLTFGGPNWKTGISLIGYLIYQVLLVAAYSHYRQPKGSANRGWVFVLAVILAIVPLVIVKITPAVEGGRQSIIGFLGISYKWCRQLWKPAMG